MTRFPTELLEWCKENNMDPLSIDVDMKLNINVSLSSVNCCAKKKSSSVKIEFQDLSEDKKKTAMGIIKRTYLEKFGYVYIMASPVMMDLFKVGFTTHSPVKRLEEISKNLHGAPIKLLRAFYVYDPRSMEKECHINLDNMRIKGSEWFRGDFFEIEECVSRVCIDAQSDVFE